MTPMVPAHIEVWIRFHLQKVRWVLCDNDNKSVIKKNGFHYESGCALTKLWWKFFWQFEMSRKSILLVKFTHAFEHNSTWFSIYIEIFCVIIIHMQMADYFNSIQFDKIIMEEQLVTMLRVPSENCRIIWHFIFIVIDFYALRRMENIPCFFFKNEMSIIPQVTHLLHNVQNGMMHNNSWNVMIVCYIN